MQIEAKNISGFLPERKKHSDDLMCIYDEGLVNGYNQAIDHLSKKKLEVVISGYDLIKLIKDTKLTDKSRNFNRSWNLTNSQAQAIGQAIIHQANTDKDLIRIEVVE